MTIDLSKDLEKIVHDAVRTGLYAREDDVIRDALLLLKQSMPGKKTKRAKECAGNNFPVFPKYVIKPSARSQTGRRAAWTPMHRKSNGR